MSEKKPKNLVEQGNMTPKKYDENGKVANPVLASEQQIKQQAEIEKIKAKLENFKKEILKKYKFTMAIGLLPMGSSPLFEEDEGLPKEVINTKPLHILMLIPEEKYNEIPKIKPEVIKIVKELKENLWVHIKTPVDLWNYGLDSKFEFIDAVSACLPVYDNGFLGALRVANIHKSLLLRKFEKYVTSYVIAGSLVRGTAGKDSDVDVFVVIDDTDVKRMSSAELLDKLRGICYDYIREATALAGVKNILNLQVYLLTDFWQSVKDAHPVMFTFIRDGIPFYDRGTFLPWKFLLKRGKIKPSPEAIDLYMKQGEQTKEIVKRRMLDTMIDIYYGIITPTQAMMMLAGEAPPVPKVVVEEVKKTLVERDKVMSLTDLKILEKAVNLFKQYEYGKLKEISGKELDMLMEEWKSYNGMLKKMREKIEKKIHEKTAYEVYADLFKTLKSIFGDKSESALLKEFESKLIKKGKVEPRFSKVIREIANIKKRVKSGKVGLKEVDSMKKDAIELIRSLVEYAQRAELVCTEKGTLMQVIYSGGRKAELVLTGKDNFLVEGKSIKRIAGDKLVEVKKEELDKALMENKGKLSTVINGELFHTLEKILGKFEVVI
ncbi:nucleotidyltransferase domain-containing protein [Candidatus Pacearchaeota archaeon]|nr:nucleotidyltransferase domain-containing protein [Candidatus Pacearchaeota archaeon]